MYMKVPLLRSLRFRLISSVVVIEVVMLSILVVSNLNAIYLAHSDRLNDTASSIMSQFTRIAAVYMAEVDYAQLDEYSHRIIENNEIGYLRVFTENNKEVVRIGNDIPKVSPAIDDHPTFIDDNRFDLKADITLAGRKFGSVEMGFTLDVMNEAVSSARNRSILIALTEIILSVAVTIFIGLWLTNNLQGLSEAAIKVGKGDLDIHLPVKGNDEIGQTTQAFNNMVEQLYQYRYQMEQLIAERTDELEEANKELEIFNHSVSHDLRSPLRAISSFSQIILEDYSDKLDESGADLLNRIDENASKMEVLIVDMLELSQVKRKELELEEVNVSLIAIEILDRYRHIEPERKVDVKIEKDVELECDRGLIIILMENLIGNAWKYSGKKERAIIEIGLVVKNGKDTVFIRDNGAGFSMKHAGKLFEAFKRLHGESEFAGTGVGLATVARVINRHGGEIWAEAEVGKGSTFYFNINV